MSNPRQAERRCYGPRGVGSTLERQVLGVLREHGTVKWAHIARELIPAASTVGTPEHRLLTCVLASLVQRELAWSPQKDWYCLVD